MNSDLSGWQFSRRNSFDSKTFSKYLDSKLYDPNKPKKKELSKRLIKSAQKKAEKGANQLTILKKSSSVKMCSQKCKRHEYKYQQIEEMKLNTASTKLFSDNKVGKPKESTIHRSIDREDRERCKTARVGLSVKKDNNTKLLLLSKVGMEPKALNLTMNLMGESALEKPVSPLAKRDPQSQQSQLDQQKILKKKWKAMITEMKSKENSYFTNLRNLQANPIQLGVQKLKVPIQNSFTEFNDEELHGPNHKLNTDLQLKYSYGPALLPKRNRK